MTPVLVFCYRCTTTAFFFGFGLTPLQAIEAAVAAGLKRALVPKGKMIQLPPGITAYSLSDDGAVSWANANPDAGGEDGMIRLEWSKTEKAFVVPVPEVSATAASPEQELIAAGRLDRLSTLKQALGTLPEEVTLDQITEQPTIGAKWNTGTLPRIGGIIHCHVHYPANGRGVDVKPGTPGLVVGYFAERGWLYCITQFPGKAVLVAAVDIIQSAATVAP